MLKAGVPARAPGRFLEGSRLQGRCLTDIVVAPTPLVSKVNADRHRPTAGRRPTADPGHIDPWITHATTTWRLPSNGSAADGLRLGNRPWRRRWNPAVTNGGSPFCWTADTLRPAS